jgi:phage shock protein PspC (stress-responsive transcriptional regulator)
MKKIININFQGRVIPIEESAYDALQRYVESLRRYFANEDGRDEIINDIEMRIAELFSERLKRDTACITEEDVNAIMASIGRPEDFGDQEETTSSNTAGAQGPQQQTQAAPAGRGRLYRNADDKILGGVCSGLANYLGIDPVIMRIAFVLLIGALFWVYILLWIIVPSQSLQTNITKRLYRNPDDKVIAGVCGGLASYFNIDVWVPRLIFALPLLIGLISGTLNAVWWNWDFGFTPRVITGSLGSTLFVTYIILWIAVPFASTASEKLEMRGERVDLNSIRDTVKEDLQNFKTKTEKFGQEVKQSAQQFGNRAKEFGQSAATQARNFSTEAVPAARRTSGGVGRAIGMLFKAFFLFIAGCIAVFLFGLLLMLVFGGMATFPLKNFVLEGTGQNFLAWGTMVFFLGVPLIALITWLVRRIMGVRSRNHYLGYGFGVLWILGLFCFIMLIGTFGRNFKTRELVEDSIAIAPVNKLVVDVTPTRVAYYHGENWFGWDWDEEIPLYGTNLDTLQLNTVRVILAKSKDSSFHVTRIRRSRGNTSARAKASAEKIAFDIRQQDSVLLMPAGFPISSHDKFRNQQVAVLIEVPVGKRIRLSKRVNRYDWFDMNMNNRRRWNDNWDDRWDETYGWDTETDYIMTPDGLKRVSELDPVELKNGRFKIILKSNDDEINAEGEFERGHERNRDKVDYRYKQIEDSIKEKAKNQLREELRIRDSLEREKKVKEAMKSNTMNTKEKANDGGDEEPLPDSHSTFPLLIFTKLSQ